MAPARRRTVRSVLVFALLALAGGGPAPRAAYAEVSAATLAVQRATVTPVAPVAIARAIATPRVVTLALPSARARVPGAPRYLTHCALLL